MLRCVLTIALAVAAGAATAQVKRDFPSTALRGEVEFVLPPDVRLNGEAARLAPGARIRGENNMLRTPASLAGQKRTVHYTIEATTGMLMDVWLLRADEVANKPWPTTPQQARQWAFDRAGQKWTPR